MKCLAVEERGVMEKCQRGGEKFQSGGRMTSGLGSHLCSRNACEWGWKGTRTDPLLPEAAGGMARQLVRLPCSQRPHAQKVLAPGAQ